VTTRLNPYIAYDGTARQAFTRYQEVFGGQLALNTFGEAGAADGPDADKIMHAMLQTPTGFMLMGSDTPKGMEPPKGSSIAISVSGDDADDLRRWFAQLSDGGQVTMPLDKQVWGDEFGMCVDAFGISWMVNITASSA
jgi:PhnB protein